MLKRRATAVWTGTGAEGSGTMETQSGALRQLPYSAHSRFVSRDGMAGTNPEELLAAAHAGCFSMALSFQIVGAGYEPEELRTEAILTMEREGVDWTITAVRLVVRGKVPDIPAERFAELAEAARAGCPLSKVLNAEITVEAGLVS